MIPRPEHLLHVIVPAPGPHAVACWMNALPLRSATCVFPQQLHTPFVRPVNRPGLVPGIDGVWSYEEPLAVRTADCAPVSVWDPYSSLKALVHAGRQGIAAGIVETTIRVLRDADQRPDRLNVWIGPHIGPCCYRFKRDHSLVPLLMSTLPHGSRIKGGELSLDLSREIAARFLLLGVKRERIGIDRRCTSCHAMRLPSHRRDGDRRRTALLTLSSKPVKKGDDQMSIDPELLKILACPETKEPVSLASAELVEKLNKLIEQGGIRNRGGDEVKETMDAGLIREDGRFLYPIRDDIPVMLIDEAIEIPPLGIA